MTSIVRDWAGKNKLKSAVISDDGKSIQLGNDNIDANEVVKVEKDGKSCRYSLASIYLQILDPNQGLIPYRNACKKYKVSDPVKVLDKSIVVGYFLGPKSSSTNSSSATTPAAPPPPPPPPRGEDRKKHRKHDRKERESHHHHRESRKRPSSDVSSSSSKKKEKKNDDNRRNAG